MYENSFGIPDALPSSYGYSDAQPATVRLNASTSRGVPATVYAPANPTSHNPAALGSPMLQQTAVVRYSSLEQDDEDDESDEEYAYGSYGAYGADPVEKDLTKKGKKPYIRFDEARKLKYRVIVVKADGALRQGAPPLARYRQYEDGSYAITYNPWPKYPSKVQADIPFTAKDNKGAHESIKKQVESLVGPFPAGAEVNYPPKGKKGKKKAKAKGKGKVDLTSALEVVGTAAKKFQDSGKATEPTDEEATSSETDVTLDEGEPWYTRKYAGVPGWGWAAGVTLLTGVGLYFAFRKPKAAAPAAPATVPASVPVEAVVAAPESE